MRGCTTELPSWPPGLQVWKTYTSPLRNDLRAHFDVHVVGGDSDYIYCGCRQVGAELTDRGWTHESLAFP